MSKRQETFKTTQNLTLENSFGVIDRENGVELEVTVGIHEGGETGWFEMSDIETGGNDWYCEGGLWIDGNVITDYDGVFSLPSCVEDKLKEWGYITEEVGE